MNAVEPPTSSFHLFSEMSPEKVHLPGIPEVADQIHHEEALEDRDKASPNDRRSMQTRDPTQTLSLEILAETL